MLRAKGPKQCAWPWHTHRIHTTQFPITPFPPPSPAFEIALWSPSARGPKFPADSLAHSDANWRENLLPSKQHAMLHSPQRIPIPVCPVCPRLHSDGRVKCAWWNPQGPDWNLRPALHPTKAAVILNSPGILQGPLSSTIKFEPWGSQESCDYCDFSELPKIYLDKCCTNSWQSKEVF